MTKGVFLPEGRRLNVSMQLNICTGFASLHVKNHSAPEDAGRSHAQPSVVTAFPYPSMLPGTGCHESPSLCLFEVITLLPVAWD